MANQQSDEHELERPPVDEGLCHQLLTVVRFQAVRRGLSAEDVEDCAGEFVLRMIKDHGHSLRLDREDDRFNAWLRRCASNFVIDFCRANRRLD